MNIWDTDPRLGRYALRDPFAPLTPDMPAPAPSPLSQAPAAQTSGFTTEPAVPQGGLMDGMGGLLGAYGGLVNPYAQTPQERLFAGVRQLGRAALSGFMAPGQAGEYIQQARVADAVQGRALQEQRTLALDAEKKERLRQALLRIDPKDPQRSEKAFQALYAVDPEAALDFQAKLGKESDDLVQVQGPDGRSRWVPKREAAGMPVGEKEPQLRTQTIVGPDGRPLIVPIQEAVGKEAYFQPAAGNSSSTTIIMPGTQTELEKEQMADAGELSLLDDALRGFKPEYYTYGGKADRFMSSMEEKVRGNLPPERAAALEKATGYIQNAQLVSSRLIHSLAGAAQSVQELERANSYAITDSDSPSQALSKLRGLRQMKVEQMKRNKKGRAEGVDAAVPVSSGDPNIDAMLRETGF